MDLNIPVWEENMCRQCLLCTPACPGLSIPVKTGRRLNVDYDSCTGCGRCAKVCPFGAINMKDTSLELGF